MARRRRRLLARGPSGRGRPTGPRPGAPPTASIADLTPAPIHVRTRAHEYGGGAYVVAGGVVVFSDFADGRLYRLDPGRRDAGPDHPGRAVAVRRPPLRCRPAALRRGPRGPRPAAGEAVERDRRRGARRRPRPARPRHGAGLRRGAAALAGRVAARLARMGPPRHALGRDPPAGRAGRPGRDPGRRRPRRRAARTSRSSSPSGRPTARSTSSPTGAAGGTCTGSSTARGSSRSRRWRRSSPTRAGSSGARPTGSSPDGSIVAVGRARRPRPPVPHRARRLRRRGRDRRSPSSRASRSARRRHRRARRRRRRSATVVRPARPGDARAGRACSAGRARWPSTRRASRSPRRSSSRPAAAGPRTPSSTRRATRRSRRRPASGRRSSCSRHGGPTSNASTGAEPRDPVLHQPRVRGGGRGLRRQHRLRPRVPRARSTGAWGIVDVDDCVAAAHAASSSAATSTRTASRSGRQRRRLHDAAALAFRDVFAAGISYFGVGDLEMLARETTSSSRATSTGWSGPTRRRPTATASARRSTASTGSRCPVLVLQGLDDRVVPPRQAEAIVAALAANGIPYAYLAFEGEGHGFRGAAAIRRSLEAELVVPRPGLRLHAGRRASSRSSARRPRCLAGAPGRERGRRPGADPGPTTTDGRPDARSSSSCCCWWWPSGSPTWRAGSASRTPSSWCSAGSSSGFVLVRVGNVPAIELPPEVVFLLFLPPILFGAGYDTPIRDFKANLRAIVLLAIGLVLFTTIVVGGRRERPDPRPRLVAGVRARRDRGAAGRRGGDRDLPSARRARDRSSRSSRARASINDAPR